MNIEELKVTVRELYADYEDHEEDGVVGYGGKLDIRPPYQREFVYSPKQRDLVIDTLTKGYPLNIMYWAVRDHVEATDERIYEVMDGQQRTISICQYVDSEFSFKGRYFHNLQKDEKEQILNYELTVYLCSGSDSDKLAWFETINIAGAELTKQELRNAVYSGTWVTDAKRYFSKNGCPAYGIGSTYLKGSPIRQDYLQTAIKWINGGDIEGYMAKQQHKPNASELWLYFKKVIDWVETTFPTYYREMQGQPWGTLYNQFGDRELDSAALDTRIAELMQDEEVEDKRGIHRYVLDGLERHLSLRSFSDSQKREAYQRQGGLCAYGSKCGNADNADGKKVFKIEEMEADHITPWHEGGKTTPDNCQMLCQFDNRSKGSR